MEARLAEGLRTLLHHEAFEEDTEISLLLCDDQFIQGLNAQYRGLDRPTDVLSFGQEEPEEPTPTLRATPPQGGRGSAGGLSGDRNALLNENTDCQPPSPLGGDPVSEANKAGRSLPRVLGDIVISLPTAARQAKKAGWPLENEVILLVVHGGLHLLGYDDETLAGAAEMQEKTAAVLTDLAIPPPVEGSHPFFVEYP